MNNSDKKPLLVKLCEFFVEDRKRIIPNRKHLPIIPKDSVRPKSLENKQQKHQTNRSTTPIDTIRAPTVLKVISNSTFEGHSDIDISESTNNNAKKENDTGLLFKVGRFVCSKLPGILETKPTCIKCKRVKCMKTSVNNGTGVTKHSSSKTVLLKRRNKSPLTTSYNNLKRSRSSKSSDRKPHKPTKLKREIEIDEPDQNIGLLNVLAEEEERKLVSQAEDTRSKKERYGYPAYYYFVDDVKTLKNAGNTTSLFQSIELLARCLVEVWDEMTTDEKYPYFLRMQEAEYQKKRKWFLENKK